MDTVICTKCGKETAAQQAAVLNIAVFKDSKKKRVKIPFCPECFDKMVDEAEEDTHLDTDDINYLRALKIKQAHEKENN